MLPLLLARRCRGSRRKKDIIFSAQSVIAAGLLLSKQKCSRFNWPADVAEAAEKKILYFQRAELVEASAISKGLLLSKQKCSG
jgi:hypothetical protein